MQDGDRRRARRRAAWLGERRHAENATVLGLAALWGTALVQFWRAWAWGVIWLPTRHGGDRLLASDPIDFWVALGIWSVFGPGFMIGIGVFLWAGRHDPA